MCTVTLFLKVDQLIILILIICSYNDYLSPVNFKELGGDNKKA